MANCFPQTVAHNILIFNSFVLPVICFLLLQVIGLLNYLRLRCLLPCLLWAITCALEYFTVIYVTYCNSNIFAFFAYYLI